MYNFKRICFNLMSFMCSQHIQYIALQEICSVAFLLLFEGYESLHLYTQNGFLVPLAAVRIIISISHLYMEIKYTKIHII